MPLTLMPMEFEFDLRQLAVSQIPPSMLIITPNERLVAEILTLPRQNERRHEEPHLEESDEQPDSGGDEPSSGVAIFVGSDFNASATSTWSVTAGDIKRIRREVLEDGAWRDEVSPHNRAVLSYLAELADSTPVLVMYSE